MVSVTVPRIVPVTAWAATGRGATPASARLNSMATETLNPNRAELRINPLQNALVQEADEARRPPNAAHRACGGLTGAPERAPLSRTTRG